MEININLDNFLEGDKVREITSPRSLEACLRSGLDVSILLESNLIFLTYIYSLKILWQPAELYPKKKSYFRAKGLTDEMVQIKFENYEKKRRGKFLILVTK